MPEPKDRQDRLDMSAVDRIQYLFQKAHETFGRHPRGGGFTLVGRPMVIRQCVVDVPRLMRRLHRAVVIGETGADIVMYFQDVPFVVRHNVKNDDLWILQNQHMTKSTPEDRQYASQLRMEAHRADQIGGSNIVLVGGN